MQSDNRKGIRQTLEEIEKKTEGRRLIRYMRDEEVVEVYSEEFFGAIKKRAALLIGRGMIGKHVGIIGENSCEWLESLGAVFYAGAVAVLIDRELSPEQIAELADRVDLEGILYDASVAAKIKETPFLGNVQKIFMGDKEREGLGQLPAPEPNPEALACIFFTSGTTAKSKAVMMSSRALAASIRYWPEDWTFQALLAVLPFHHLAGFVVALNALYLGAEVCLAGDMKRFYHYLRVMKPDYVFVVPSMLQVLARKVKNGGDNGRLLGWDLHYVNCGGATFYPELLQTFLDRKIGVFQGYGASETGGVGFMCKMEPERPDTIGKPSANMAIKIEDHELLIQSESIMMGYYQDPEATAQVLCDGWYKTGDLCYRDEEGYVYLTGRKRNVIILSNGENVSPEEIETTLHACKEICEIVVEECQDQIAAVIFPEYPMQSDEAEKEAIRMRIRETVEGYNQKAPFYKQVHKVIFREEPFEKTAGGKIIRQKTGGGNEL